MKTALITGVRGQDGAYLAKFLLEKDYKVYGADRRTSEGSGWRLEYLNISHDIEFVYMDLLESSNVNQIVQKIKPDEIYNLAAQSFVGNSFNQPILTTQVNAIGVLNLLEAIRYNSPESRFYQASTSEMFGDSLPFQDENTVFCPNSPYAFAKLLAHWAAINYRKSYNLFACCGILFNHESPLRGIEFVTRKITNTIAKIKLGLADKLILGNLDAQRDWGYAPEYVEAMWLMLRQNKADDYVIASGTAASVKYFVERTFEMAEIPIKFIGKGIDQRGVNPENGNIIVEISKDFYRPAEVNALKGCYAKAKKALNWSPQTNLDSLIEIMYKADYERLKN